MKKKIMMMTASLMLIVGTSALTACGGASEAEEGAKTEEGSESREHADHEHYACPMDCEKGKVYDEEGSCPICGMDLEKVES